MDVTSVGDVCAVDRLFVGEMVMCEPSVDAEPGATSVGDKMGGKVNRPSSDEGSVLTLYKPCLGIECGKVDGFPRMLEEDGKALLGKDMLPVGSDWRC